MKSPPTPTWIEKHGHEMLDDFGLIHMNGRIYDPQIGRFLSVDPFVQAPANSQSFNRYSYVMNNPLSATDPSGYVCVGFAVTWIVRDFSLIYQTGIM